MTYNGEKLGAFIVPTGIGASIGGYAGDASAYVRKIGDIYTVQMGSYQDFYTAKSKAQDLKAKGLDVWIYQQ